MIHPTAVVEPGAKIGNGSTVGPYCHIGANVVVGEGAELKSHCVLAGHTTIGKNVRVFPFASIGHEPQDLKHKGEITTLTIGDNCVFREGVTVNPGTAGDRGETVIGNGSTFLANAHVAHDCVVGNHVIFSNNVMLAGHCQVGDYVIIGGGAGIHQFCRIGESAFIGGLAGVENDVIPYGVALGNRAYLGGINIVGMRRAGVKKVDIQAVRALYKKIFDGETPVKTTIESVNESDIASAEGRKIYEFITNDGDRALCTPTKTVR